MGPLVLVPSLGLLIPTGSVALSAMVQHLYRLLSAPEQAVCQHLNKLLLGSEHAV